MSASPANAYPTQAELEPVRRALAENPGGVLEATAAEHGLPLQTVIECLPGAMWTRVAGDRFVEVMEDLSEWGAVTVIAHTKDIILEVEGPVPPGKLGHGFYNLHGDSPIGGHLRAENCKAILFLRRPFMGTETLSVQFFNADGEAMFKVFVGRDRNRALKPEQVARFAALEARLGNAAELH
jgi:putative heme utilization carrier protein HutX